MSLRQRRSVETRITSQASVHLVWIGRMLLITASVYSLAILMAPTKSKEGSFSCKECTYVIDDTTSTEYRLQGGEKICIREGGRFTGRILRWQGKETCQVCNEGTFLPSQLKLESGINIVENYGQAEFKSLSAHTPSLSFQLTNHEEGKIKVDQLIINGPTHKLTNKGEFSIGDLTIGNKSTLTNEASGRMNILFQTELKGQWKNHGKLFLGKRTFLGQDAELMNGGEIWVEGEWKQKGGFLQNEGFFQSTREVVLDSGSVWKLPGDMVLLGGLVVENASIRQIHKLLIDKQLSIVDSTDWEVEGKLLFTGKRVKGQLTLTEGNNAMRPVFSYLEPSVRKHVRKKVGSNIRLEQALGRDIQKERYPVTLTVLPHLRKIEAQIQLPAKLAGAENLQINRYLENPATKSSQVYKDKDISGNQVYHWTNDSLVEGIQYYQVEVTGEGRPSLWSEPVSVLHIDDQATVIWDYWQRNGELEIRWFSAMKVQAQWVIYNEAYEVLERTEARLNKGSNEVLLQLENLEAQAFYLRLEAEDTHLFYPFIPIQ